MDYKKTVIIISVTILLHLFLMATCGNPGCSCDFVHDCKKVLGNGFNLLHLYNLPYLISLDVFRYGVLVKLGGNDLVIVGS